MNLYIGAIQIAERLFVYLQFRHKNVPAMPLLAIHIFRDSQTQLERHVETMGTPLVWAR